MNAGRLWGVGAGLATLLAAMVLARQAAEASQLLTNPDFEDWSGNTAVGWAPQGVASPDYDTAVSGAAMRLEAGSYVVSQYASATPGASYSASVYVASGGTGTARLVLAFKDDGFEAITQVTGNLTAASGTFTQLTVSGGAPAGAAWIQFLLDIESDDAMFVDGASLDESAPPPSPTATPTQEAAPTPTHVATAYPSPTAPGVTSTPTRTPPRTSTPSRTPTPTRTPTPRPQPTSGDPPSVILPTSTPPGGGGASSGGSFGGLLLNGDFEVAQLEDRTKPKHWVKYGGEVSLSPNAFRGQHAASLASATDSTKWLYQLVQVTPGQWYQASAHARVASGQAEVFIRLSWYPFSDGGGSALVQDDGSTSSSNAWQLLDTGPVQAPEGAYSVRVRLMVRPSGPATALFDDATFIATSAPATSPTSSPTPLSTVAGTRNPGSGSATTRTSTANPRGTSAPSDPSGAPPPFVSLPGPHTLRLSEVLSDPEEAGRDGPFEWVELVNVGSEPVSTTGWRIGDATRTDAVPEATVPPGGFLVVAGSEADLPAVSAVIRLDDGQIGNGLNNDGDTLILLAPDGTQADTISFGDDVSVFEPAPPAPLAGETLGVRTAGAEPDPANWAITLRPTPGEPNLFAATTTGTTSPLSPTSHAAEQGPNGPSEIQEGAGARSPLPWILLGGAAAAGGMVIASAGRGRAENLWRRLRRGR